MTVNAARPIFMRYVGEKGKVWEAVRAYIRLRDGDRCFTCWRNGPDFKYDTGHCWPVSLVGSNNTLSWDERQIAVQCKYCNGVGQGMQEQFVANLISKYGAKTVNELRARVHKVDPVKDWKSLKDTYEEKKRKIALTH